MESIQEIFEERKISALMKCNSFCRYFSTVRLLWCDIFLKA